MKNLKFLILLNAMKRKLFLLCIPLLLWGCEKDLFVDELAPLEGTWGWEYSYWLEVNWLVFDYEYIHHYRYPSEDGFNAQVSFFDGNRMSFRIDDEEITERKFKVRDQYMDNGKLYLEIKVDVNKNDLDIDDKLELIYYNDTLQINRFPHDGYTGENHGSNYFTRR